VFLGFSFLYNAGIPAIREHLTQKLAVYVFMDFQDLLAQNAVWEGVMQC